MDKNPNLAMLMLAVERLGELCDEMVFLGGCATGLLISDPAAAPVRMTRDVDAIVQVASRAEYYRLADRLRQQGFQEDVSDDAPICRWLAGELILDVMPTESDILGFGNDWYQVAMEHAEAVYLPSGGVIQMVTAPYFLITKLEAFAGRGGGDYQLSHDMEDIIAVLDGRSEILDEIQQVEIDLQRALAEQFKKLLASARFVEAVSGHMPPDGVSQTRVPRIMKLLRAIAEMK